MKKEKLYSLFKSASTTRIAAMIISPTVGLSFGAMMNWTWDRCIAAGVASLSIVIFIFLSAFHTHLSTCIEDELSDL